MATQIVNDAASLERLGKLLAHVESSAAEWALHAERAREGGHTSLADYCEQQALVAQATADRIRMRLVALSGLTEGDVAVTSGSLADLLAKPTEEPPAEVPVTAEPASSCPLSDCATWPAEGTRPSDESRLPTAPTVEPSHLTPEPPARLADLYAWLRARLGAAFPRVTAETWQRVAYLLLTERRGP